MFLKIEEEVDTLCINKMLHKLNLNIFSFHFDLILRALIPKRTYTAFKNECSQFKKEYTGRFHPGWKMINMHS